MWGVSDGAGCRPAACEGHLGSSTACAAKAVRRCRRERTETCLSCCLGGHRCGTPWALATLLPASLPYDTHLSGMGSPCLPAPCVGTSVHPFAYPPSTKSSG